MRMGGRARLIGSHGACDALQEALSKDYDVEVVERGLLKGGKEKIVLKLKDRTASSKPNTTSKEGA